MEREWQHESVYSDVETLNKTGSWPGGKVPAWVAERVEVLGGSEMGSGILEMAYCDEISRLKKENELLFCGFYALSSFILEWHDACYRTRKVIGNLVEQLTQKKRTGDAVTLAQGVSHVAFFVDGNEDVFRRAIEFTAKHQKRWESKDRS